MKRLIYIFALLFVTLSLFAKTMTGGEILYLNANFWDPQSARFAAYFYGTGNKWENMKSIGGGVYVVVVPSGTWTNVIFCRMNKGNQTNDWNNKWNQTGDLTYNGTNNFFKITKWDNQTSGWSSFTWTLEGSSTELFGGNWNTDSINQLELQSNGKYTKTYSNKKLSKGVIEYKVFDNSGSISFPKDNGSFEIEKDGFYDITFSFDILTQKISVTNKKQNPFEIKAGGEYLFLKPSDWEVDNARFAMYYFSGEDNYWVDMVELKSHSGIYYALLPEGSWYNIIFVRMNPSVSANDWNNKWNQTNDLIYDGSNNEYTITGWGEGLGANSTGTWSVLETKESDIIKGLDAGGYYGKFTYQKTISGDDVKKWHWISLPYNVKISDIEGGEYGSDFIIQKYDTEARAKWENNIAAENESAWRWMDDSETLLAGKGYILAVSDAKDSYSLTFVSETDLNVVSDRFEGNNIDYSSAVAESANWHLVGTGVYGSVGDYEGVNYVAVPQSNGNDYDYYSLSEGSNNRLAPYSAFFVQYAGDYSFTKASGEQPALAPRLAKKVDDVERYYVDIKGESEEAQTAIFLAVDGTEDYVVGQDFLHLGASGASLQLYSLQGQNILSFNYLQSIERTIALGGYIAKGGIYEISLRAIGNATSIVLYDKFTGEGIDLLSDTYEFEAEKGAIDGRFEIIISYAQQGGTTTELSGEDFGNLSVLLNNELVVFEGLTLGEDVMIYDVMGRCVKLFKATEQKAEICLVGGAYLLHHNNETIKFIVNK